MFTDIVAAIEECRYQKQQLKYHYAVVQIQNGLMKVVSDARARKYPQLGVMFRTKNDKHHTVLPEVR